MRRITACLATAAIAVSMLATSAFADAAKKYQVTGVVTELTTDKVVLTKADGEKWELKRDAADADDAKLKMGDKVTVMYTMVVGSVEVKAAAAASGGATDAPAKAAAAPAN